MDDLDRSPSHPTVKMSLSNRVLGAKKTSPHVLHRRGWFGKGYSLRLEQSKKPVLVEPISSFKEPRELLCSWSSPEPKGRGSFDEQVTSLKSHPHLHLMSELKQQKNIRSLSDFSRWVMESLFHTYGMERRGTSTDLSCLDSPNASSTPPLRTLCEEEWHMKRNEGTTPHTIPYTSLLAKWWRCSRCGHEFLDRVRYRCLVRGPWSIACPRCICASERLALFAPSLSAEFAGEIRDAFSKIPVRIAFDSLTAHDLAIVLWRCQKCQTRWQASIVSRFHAAISLYRNHTIPLSAVDAVCPLCSRIGALEEHVTEVTLPPVCRSPLEFIASLTTRAPEYRRPRYLPKFSQNVKQEKSETDFEHVTLAKWVAQSNATEYLGELYASSLFLTYPSLFRELDKKFYRTSSWHRLATISTHSRELLRWICRRCGTSFACSAFSRLFSPQRWLMTPSSTAQNKKVIFPGEEFKQNTVSERRESLPLCCPKCIWVQTTYMEDNPWNNATPSLSSNETVSSSIYCTDILKPTPYRDTPLLASPQALLPSLENAKENKGKKQHLLNHSLTRFHSFPSPLVSPMAEVGDESKRKVSEKKFLPRRCYRIPERSNPSFFSRKHFPRWVDESVL